MIRCQVVDSKDKGPRWAQPPWTQDTPQWRAIETALPPARLPRGPLPDLLDMLPRLGHHTGRLQQYSDAMERWMERDRTSRHDESVGQGDVHDPWGDGRIGIGVHLGAGQGRDDRGAGAKETAGTPRNSCVSRHPHRRVGGDNHPEYSTDACGLSRPCQPFRSRRDRQMCPSPGASSVTVTTFYALSCTSPPIARLTRLAGPAG